MGRFTQKSLSNARGQVAILFALIFSFMFVLFAFVVDFAHLIHNRINLQLAADMAAYSGAAYQASTLNRVSMVNYRLRQNMKELAMRIGVTHARHNSGFPRGIATIQGPPSLSSNSAPYVCQQAHGYQSISGVSYATDTNLCKNAAPGTGGLPPIVVPPLVAAWDPFAAAIVAAVGQIAIKASQECSAGSLDNQVLSQHFATVYPQRAQFHMRQINAIKDFLNNLTSVGPQTLGSNPSHPIASAAYQSAVRNLTLANKDGFRFEILQPSTGQYLDLNEHQMSGDVYYLKLTPQGSGCVGSYDFRPIEMPVGVSKRQEVLTYFAVKLTSRPRMLFMPQAWVDRNFPELTAIAVAKPFGSRVGPPLVMDPLIPNTNGIGTANRLINFSFSVGDTLGIRNTKIMAYLDALHSFQTDGAPDGSRNTGWPEPFPANQSRFALTAIRAPSAFDAAFFSLFPDPQRTSDYIESSRLFPDYMEVGTQEGTAYDGPKSSTPAYFATQSSGSGAAGYVPVYVKPNELTGTGAYSNYTFETPASHSVSVITKDGFQFINEDSAKDFGYANVAQVHSGWAPTDPGADGAAGRLGYSVKLVSFDLLTRTLQIRNSAGALQPIENLPVGLAGGMEKTLH